MYLKGLETIIGCSTKMLLQLMSAKKVEALESFNKVYRNSTANEKAFAQTSYLAALVEAT